MPRRKKARYGREMRARAADLFEAGLGFELAAKKLDVPAPAVRKWLYAYRATGRKGLIGMGESRRTYDMDVSVNLFFTSFAKQARRSRKGGFTGCANVFSPIPVTA